ncbi:response regulator transcription factor [Myxococcaceae bacterium JPH2]|nr:response regulator transcription factor [Myxococcaceae bacterium JPH2]
MHILVVEDDRMLASAALAGLREHGHSCEWVEDLEQARPLLLDHRFTAVLLDLGLPDGSGLDLLSFLRKRYDSTPVLIVTARDQLSHRIRGLDAGADDYIVKPFQLAELEARLRAVVRRAQGRVSPLLGYGQITVDPERRTVSRAGLPVAVSAHEFRMLKALLERKGRVLSRGQLEDEVYEGTGGKDSNTIAVYVHQLRRKLGEGLIETVHGLGYRIGNGDA